MTWVYKSRYKMKDDIKVNDILPICSKCHYILLLRPGERAYYCPMCGEQHLKVEGEKKGKT